MARERKVRVRSGSELDRLLEEAAAGPLLLEKDGELYRLHRAEDTESLWAGYDPEEVRTALAKTAGAWADIDTEALIAELYRAREEGSRPTSRP